MINQLGKYDRIYSFKQSSYSPFCLILVKRTSSFSLLKWSSHSVALWCSHGSCRFESGLQPVRIQFPYSLRDLCRLKSKQQIYRGCLPCLLSVSRAVAAVRAEQMARDCQSSWRFIHRCVWWVGETKTELERWGGTAVVVMLEWVYNVSIQAVNLSCVAVFKCVYASLSMHYLLHYCCVAATASESHALSVGVWKFIALIDWPGPDWTLASLRYLLFFEAACFSFICAA